MKKSFIYPVSMMTIVLFVTLTVKASLPNLDDEGTKVPLVDKSLVWDSRIEIIKMAIGDDNMDVIDYTLNPLEKNTPVVTSHYDTLTVKFKGETYILFDEALVKFLNQFKAPNND